MEIRHLDMTRNFFPFFSESYMSKRKYLTLLYDLKFITNRKQKIHFWCWSIHFSTFQLPWRLGRRRWCLLSLTVKIDVYPLQSLSELCCERLDKNLAKPTYNNGLLSCGKPVKECNFCFVLFAFICVMKLLNATAREMKRVIS